jgi:hypothetical protein
MSAEELRSISQGSVVAMVCGFCGCVIGSWLKKKWSRWVPERVGVKGRARLLREHSRTILIAHSLSLAGVLVGLLCYKSGWLSNHDWRGLGLMFGTVSVLPVAYIAAANAKRGPEAVKEVFVTIAISEGTPVRLYFGIMATFFVAGVASAVSLLLYR